MDLEEESDKTINKGALNTSKVIAWYKSLGISMILHWAEFMGLAKDEGLSLLSSDVKVWLKESKYFKSDVSSKLPSPEATPLFGLIIIMPFLSFNGFLKNGHRKYFNYWSKKSQAETKL